MYIPFRLLTALLLCLTTLSLHSELLVIKKNKDAKGQETFASLDEFDKESSKTISGILLKYQWPMCIASDLTDTEKNELLSPNKPYAEIIFIQNKIRAVLKNDSYAVVFIPTALYELFCIDYFFKTIKESNPFQEAVTRFLTGGVNGYLITIDLTEILQLNASPAEIRKKIFAEYQKVNDIFLTAAPSAAVHVNNAILDVLLTKYSALKSAQDAQQIADFVREKSDELKHHLVKEITAGFMTFKGSKGSYLENNVQRMIERIQQEGQANIISKVFALEYEAASKNMGILIRGTTFEEVEIGFGEEQRKVSIAGTTMREQLSGVKGAKKITFGQKYKERSFELYSIAFGNSLFGGFFMDYNACAYYFLSGGRMFSETSHSYLRTAGYALFIDKKAYVEHANANLFFISPLAPIGSLFAKGEYFHSRTKAAIASKSGEGVRIKSLYGAEIKDPTGVLLVTREPIQQAKLFARFLAENGRVIQSGDEKDFTDEEREFAQKALENQQQAAQFYGTSQKVEEARQKFIRKIKDKKETEPERQQKMQKNIVDILNSTKDSLAVPTEDKQKVYESALKNLQQVIEQIEELKTIVLKGGTEGLTSDDIRALVRKFEDVWDQLDIFGIPLKIDKVLRKNLLDKIYAIHRDLTRSINQKNNVFVGIQ